VDRSAHWPVSSPVARSLASSHSHSAALPWRPPFWAHRHSPSFLLDFALSSLFPSPFPSFTMPPAPVRRPSASANHSSSTPSSSVRQHRSAESHHAFATMSTQPPSFYSSNTSSAAAHQQKIIHILVNRLRNKVHFLVLSLPLPCSSFAATL
jgi:hypothetical protein